jgi:hypothetical protein
VIVFWAGFVDNLVTVVWRFFISSKYRGGTTTSLKKHIEDLDLTPFNTVILQFGGNDADRDIEFHDFNRNYLTLSFILFIRSEVPFLVKCTPSE